MEVKKPRPYHSPHREAQATVTRRRILSTAETLFGERGFAAVTMDAIARLAGVSLATVYLYFPGKVSLLAALADEIAAAPELNVEQVERAVEPLEQLRVGVGIIRRLNERSWRIADVLRSAQGSDEDLRRIWAVWQERHLGAIRRAIDAVQARHGLRAGLDPDEAVDVFYAVAGTEVYRALVQEREWAPDRYEAWLFRLGRAELLGIGSETEAPRSDLFPSGSSE